MFAIHGPTSASNKKVLVLDAALEKTQFTCTVHTLQTAASTLTLCVSVSMYFCVPESLQWHRGPISGVDYVSELFSWGREPNHTVRRGVGGGWGGSPHEATQITPEPNISVHCTSTVLAVITAVCVSDSCDVCRVFRDAKCVFSLPYMCVCVCRWETETKSLFYNKSIRAEINWFIDLICSCFDTW